MASSNPKPFSRVSFLIHCFAYYFSSYFFTIYTLFTGSRRWRLWLNTLALVMAPSAHATGLASYTPQFSVYVDSSRALTIEEVRRLPAEAFKLSAKAGYVGGSSGTTPPTPQQLSLNADNYDEIAISVSNQLDDFIQRLRTPLAANDRAGVIQAALLQSVQTLLPDEAGQQALADLVINQQACNSGEANTDNTGDEVRYQFNACVKNGYTFNGELSSQHTPGSAQARLSYRTFKAEDGEGEAITLVGDKTLTLTMESANQRVRSEVSAGDLVASNAQGRSTQRQGYTLDYTRIGTEWRLSVNGTVQLTTSKTPRCS